MKQKQFCEFPLFTIMVVLVLLGCTKQGPSGATGPQGPQGVAGPGGPGGSKGDTGTANVIYSKWNSLPNAVTAIFDIPQITQNILDNGVVLVYFRGQTQNDIMQLNYSTLNFYAIYVAFPGKLYLTSSANLDFYAYRYVIIPGAVPSGNSIPKDYKSLCQQYNIPDN